MHFSRQLTGPTAPVDRCATADLERRGILTKSDGKNVVNSDNFRYTIDI